MNLPRISIEKLNRGKEYATPYVAHIIGDGFDHHGEAESPELALDRASQHWLSSKATPEGFSLSMALTVLADCHTRDDVVAGFTVQHTGDFMRWSQGDYIEAWKVVRAYIHRETEPAE